MMMFTYPGMSYSPLTSTTSDLPYHNTPAWGETPVREHRTVAYLYKVHDMRGKGNVISNSYHFYSQLSLSNITVLSVYLQQIVVNSPMIHALYSDYVLSQLLFLLIISISTDRNEGSHWICLAKSIILDRLMVIFTVFWQNSSFLAKSKFGEK